MNYVILDGEYLEESKLNLFISNRAFKFGDAVFETMVYVNNEIRLFNYHWERLEKGMQVLKFEYDQSIDNELIKSKIFKLIALNNIKSKARIRLQVFRNGQGTYTPITNTIGYSVELKPMLENTNSILSDSPYINVGFCDSIQLNYSILSSLKTCNSLPYILASIEKEKRALNDLIIFNYQNFIAECCASNIFWSDGIKVYTPSLASGCIEGVMRKHLISSFNQKNIAVEEGLYLKQNLKEAQFILTSNCTGVKLIDTIIENDKIWHQSQKNQLIDSPIFASIQSLL